MSFTAEIWQKNAALFETIRTMPFNQELADGTLSQERFRHYMIQDAHYLIAFGPSPSLRQKPITQMKSSSSRMVRTQQSLSNAACMRISWSNSMSARRLLRHRRCHRRHIITVAI